jgi:hypothetical protein
MAGQSVQLANGETVTLMSGQDTQFITGGQMRVHSGQAIGILGGAMKAGDQNVGLQMIAAKDAIDIQAQAGTLTVQARDEVNVMSANAHIDWASPKSISLSTAGGANITISGGNITVQCPGKLVINAGKKSFTGPESTSYPLPQMPTSSTEPVKFGLRLQDIPGTHGVVPVGESWKVVHMGALAMDDGDDEESGGVDPQVYSEDNWREVLCHGTVPGDGVLPLTDDERKKVMEAVKLQPGRIWLISGLTAMPLNTASWTTTAAQPNPRRVLDALNFAPHGSSLDDATADYIGLMAKENDSAVTLNSLKSKVDL